MKRILAAAALMIAVSTQALGQTTQSQPGQSTSAAQQGSSAAEQEVSRVLQEYDAAILKQDAAAFERLLADDYTLIEHTGRIIPKAEMVATARAGDVKFEVGKTDDQKIRVYGDMALAIGRWTEKSTSKGKPFSGTMRFAAVLLKRDGRWQILSDQTTLIAPENP